jgi:hypothetical protein
MEQWAVQLRSRQKEYNMKVIAQPESYSDMLERIFVVTVATGIICTLILASASPDVKALLDSIKTETDVGPIKGLKVLYVLVPIAVSMIFRIVRLHDWISDRLRIRLAFDTWYILFPLAQSSGHTLDKRRKQCIRSVRESAMYKVFYPYAGFATPAIDKQLIRTALDNWGWFWSWVESEVLLVVSSIVVKAMGGDAQFWICLNGSFLIALLLLTTWFACRRSADRQVRAIVDDPQRKSDIYAYFAEILRGSTQTGNGDLKSEESVDGPTSEVPGLSQDSAQVDHPQAGA